MSLYVGLISDTHGVFGEPFREFFSPVDVIWHAGDWGGDEAFVRSITEFKPVVGVHGNCDGAFVRYEYPAYQMMKVGGLTVVMTHIGGSPGHYDPRARQLLDTYKPDVFICGHSHILRIMNDRQRSLLYVNPGAAGLQGWQIVRTALRFRIGEGGVKDMEVFEYPKNSSIFAD